ncbi:MAG: PQQ-binding-like beta-propeller repeat protein [Armatimonadetes bacterium]|nr:PQQ-binding-like beta-propeller repeat protein [Armatimonadota bacterium]
MRGWLLKRVPIIAFALCFVCGVHAGITQDFTFVQATDVHACSERAAETSPRVISKITTLSETDLASYGVKAPKPDFVIVTGDLTEFGGSDCWKRYLEYWENFPIPVHHLLGNHDTTWHAILKQLRETGREPWFSFDHKGCHFVGLTTATVQDPRPSIGEEQINWLKKDLSDISPETPLFVAFHHPIGKGEFASRYDYDRLLDVLRERNTILLIAGHSHKFVSEPFEDFDQITAGSTGYPTPGVALISIVGDVVRAAYLSNGGQTAATPIIEKKIPPKPVYAKTEIVWPKPRVTVGEILGIAAYTTTEVKIARATFTVDDSINGDLHIAGSPGRWTAAGWVDISSLTAGAHYLRVEFYANTSSNLNNGRKVGSRSAEFFYEPPDKPTAWRVYLGASTKCTPTVADGIVYVGANDGKLRAIDIKTGKVIWTVETGAEIVAQPLIVEGNVIVANGLGLVQAFSKTGKELWKFVAEDAVYSSPTLVDGKIAFGCNNGKLYILDPSTGTQLAINDDATYTIESKPFSIGGRVYYGAWDQYVRCVKASDGGLVWKQLGEGSLVQEAKRYYSPADAGPVVADGKLFVADRDYMLTIIDAETGERLDARKSVSATGLSEDGKFVYLRRTDGKLEKIDSSGKEIWSIFCDTGYIPAAPIEKDGVVYVASDLGMVSAVSAKDGKLLWRYQASPRLFVMSSVTSDGRLAYVTSFDGMVTAIRCDRAADGTSGLQLSP